MKYITTLLLSFFILILLSACTEKTHEKRESSNVFSVSQHIINSDHVLTILLPEKRPSKLSIISPDGQLFIVHSQEDNISFVPYEDKIDTKQIIIPISSLKGTTWIDGKKLEQLVFKKRGKYTVYMADNLETEPENTFHFKQDIELK